MARATNHGQSDPADQFPASTLSALPNSDSFPQNPASGGIPARLNMNTAMATARNGRVRPRPANSSTASIWRSRRPRNSRAANVPIVATAYTQR